MPFYADEKTFYSVMQRLFDRIQATPGALDELRRSHLTICVQVTQPQATLTLDFHNPPGQVLLGPNNRPTDLEISMPADLLHRIWMNQERLRTAFFTGKMQTKGSIFTVTHLQPLFRRAEELYPQVLKEMGFLQGSGGASGRA